MLRSSLGLAFAVVTLAACSTETLEPLPAETTASSSATGGGAGGSGGAPACGSAGDLDTTGLVELSFDDGLAANDVRTAGLSIDIGSGPIVLGQEILHEAVRFELPHPARIHGFAVAWAADGVDGATELEAGLYPDFGYNGFDFWAPDPYWTGSRCAADATSEGGVAWHRYALDEPLEVAHPGLIYVAHQAAPAADGVAADPVWRFDGATGADCGVFDDCQSAFNLPEVTTQYNGLSFSFQQHFLVRLYVEYTEQLDPNETLFQPGPSTPASAHASWGDYDNDGWDDLLLGSNSCAAPASCATLLHNEGDGTFMDASAPSGVANELAATGGVWGDYDNDGCLDLLLFYESYTVDDVLLHNNCDGTFTDVTAAAGIVDEQTYNDCGDNPANTSSPSAAAAWVDLDADGFLDLYLANFNCWDPNPEIEGEGYTYYHDTVFLNDGDGTFSEITGDNGFGVSPTPSRGVAPIDHDRDGDIDVFVNNYVLKPNLLFDNQGDGTVLERAKQLGAAGTVGPGGYYGHTIGAAWGDLDNDGDFDNVSANLAHPRFFNFSNKTQILLNDGTGNYADASGAWRYPASDAGLRYQETHSVPVLADIDQDGALDLAITCVYDGRPTDFYWGNGDGTFALDAYHAGITTENGWGVAAADYDHDGDMDLFATTLFENAVAGAGHFLQVRLTGTTANRAAIGATVAVTAGTNTFLRHVEGGTGKGGQDSLYLHFGLGDAGQVDEIRVTYPGGDEDVYTGPIAADQRVWLEQGTTTVETGWAPP